MRKHLKMLGEGILLFAISLLFLWILFGAVRLHTLNEELETHIEHSKRTIEELQQTIEDANPESIEEHETLVVTKVRYIKLSYLLTLNREILREENSIVWSLLDVYSRQKALWWGYRSLLDAEFFIELHDDYFLPSADSEDIAKMENMLDEKQEKTQCFLKSQPPQGLLNQRTYTNIEPLRNVLEDICSDYETEDELLYRAFQAEAAYFLSSYIQGFSRMKWYEQPIYGWFPKEGFVTFRYIWLDISYMIGISLFISLFTIWWRYRDTANKK